VATEAARAEFPGGGPSEVSSLDQALRSETGAAPSVLVLGEPTDADVARALQARDGAGLPRWAVVLVRSGSPNPEAEAVASEDWTPSVAGRVLRWAAASNRLQREIASLRGDLLTFGLRIAHDLRTPLGGVAVSAETLKDALAEDCPADLSLVRPISDSCDEMAAMIRQVSVLAKATARPVPQERVPMGTAVWAARERLAQAIKESGATISEAKSWPEVVGDPVSLETIWMNLLSNAVRHSGKAPRIELGWEPATDGMKFWVSDHGPGIPERNRKLLFHPFNRLHEPNAIRGLGLSIAQRLVQLLGGRCGYEPVPTGGSSFFFVLASAGAPAQV
jgi:signal transduction histidine kinase